MYTHYLSCLQLKNFCLLPEIYTDTQKPFFLAAKTCKRLSQLSEKGSGNPLQYSWASLWLSWKRIRLQWGRPGFETWVGKIPWRRERLPTPVFWPENSMDCMVHGVEKFGHDWETFTSHAKVRGQSIQKQYSQTI